MARFGEERVGAMSQQLEPLRSPEWRAAVRNVGARAVTLVDEARPLQFQVSAGNRIRIDDELLRQRADRRQFLAWSQPARGNEVFHLVDDLAVDRQAVAR